MYMHVNVFGLSPSKQYGWGEGGIPIAVVPCTQHVSSITPSYSQIHSYISFVRHIHTTITPSVSSVTSICTHAHPTPPHSPPPHSPPPARHLCPPVLPFSPILHRISFLTLHTLFCFSLHHHHQHILKESFSPLSCLKFN